MLKVKLLSKSQGYQIMQCIFERLCLLTRACDMFQYNPVTTQCTFFPNQQKKFLNLHDIVLPPSSPSPESVYVLHCSTPMENLLINSDPFTNSRERKIHMIQECIEALIFYFYSLEFGRKYLQNGEDI